MINLEKQPFLHLKTGKTYILEFSIGLKLFRRWFYFLVYRNPQSHVYYVRTERDFMKKFEITVDYSTGESVVE